MRRARMIYNPASGREQVKKYVPDILEFLERKCGYETSVYSTENREKTLNEVQRICKSDYELIIVAGGDGTVHEVINGMALESRRPPLALIPAGTTNDFASALGLPFDIRDAYEHIAAAKLTHVDIGRMNDQFFINIAGGGSLTELTYEVPAKLKTMIGQLAYYLKGIEKVVMLSPSRLSIESKDFQFEGEAMFFLITNTKHVGGFKNLAPRAKVDDGLFDVFIVKRMKIYELVSAISLAVRGRHMDHPGVLFFQTDQLKIDCEGELAMNLDGEHGGYAPCTIRNLKRHIQILS
ncbi:YegS/Rv2252/BmrU family lipid kinase [Alicyclobacillus dauci]|uniref:YegS/Rv2252/BmrU family lipid kinase n=1 Tax=Alicyclobacillus dauci TaxID=1475485 RepID=A0ABY6Z623_9BACL|nr:YegS/Rv2252/BmrU family lipid kinase [Alicyclobacillus dauci]WAH38214.1 YegS/Rv2252/BmrU family lipid kinase [Alicyclobacillus dauci]